MNRIWAIHGLTVGSHIYLFYHRITLLKGVDVFTNFKLDGMGIARADNGDLRFTRLKAPDGTHLFWKGTEPTFGVFVTRSDEYIYLWGSLITGMHLCARVRAPLKIWQATSISWRRLDQNARSFKAAVEQTISANGQAVRLGPERDVGRIQPVFAEICGLPFTAPREQDRDADSSPSSQVRGARPRSFTGRNELRMPTLSMRPRNIPSWPEKEAGCNT